MAYPTPVAAALSGATVRQLAYWRNTRTPSGALLDPEYRPSRARVLYSFRDVVALRTVVYLREESSLQKIRRAIDNLRDLGSLDHLSEYRLIADGDSIVVAHDDEESLSTDLVESPGQIRLIAQFSDVVRPFANPQGENVVDLYRPRPRLRVHPEVRGGFPVIKDTRIPFDQVASLVADGVAPAEIRDYYPGVSATAASDAHDFGLYVRRLEAAS